MLKGKTRAVTLVGLTTLILAPAAHATVWGAMIALAWQLSLPTGKTKFTPQPLPKVTAAAGQSVTLQATLLMQRPDRWGADGRPATYYWDPVTPSTVREDVTVHWTITLKGTQYCFTSTPGGRGKATLTWRIPKKIPAGTRGTYTASYAGGTAHHPDVSATGYDLKDAPLQGCSASGTIVVQK